MEKQATCVRMDPLHPVSVAPTPLSPIDSFSPTFFPLLQSALTLASGQVLHREMEVLWVSDPFQAIQSCKLCNSGFLKNVFFLFLSPL